MTIFDAILNLLCHFKGLLGLWQNFESTLSIFAIGQSLIQLIISAKSTFELFGFEKLKTGLEHKRHYCLKTEEIVFKRSLPIQIIIKPIHHFLERNTAILF